MYVEQLLKHKFAEASNMVNILDELERYISCAVYSALLARVILCLPLPLLWALRG